MVAESIHDLLPAAAQPRSGGAAARLRRDLAEGAPAERAPKPLAGKTFVLTGTLPTLSRDEAKDLLEAAGAQGRPAR